MIEKYRIKAIALNSGFKLKEQTDGNMDLNPYVYELCEESKSYLLERNAILRLTGSGDK